MPGPVRPGESGAEPGHLLQLFGMAERFPAEPMRPWMHAPILLIGAVVENAVQVSGTGQPHDSVLFAVHDPHPHGIHLN